MGYWFDFGVLFYSIASAITLHRLLHFGIFIIIIVIADHKHFPSITFVTLYVFAMARVCVRVVHVKHVTICMNAFSIS